MARDFTLSQFADSFVNFFFLSLHIDFRIVKSYIKIDWK